jgi:diguanylate cyclase (GGDEF)-like protein
MFKSNINEITLQMRLHNQKKQRYVWISFFAYIVKRYRNVPIHIRGLLKDIDNEKRQSLELEQMDKLFKETRKLANITTFYHSFNEGEFTASLELDEFLGIEKLTTVEQIRRIVHPEDIEVYDYTTNEIINSPHGLIGEYRIIKNNETRYIQSSVFGDIDESGTVIGAFGILKDITTLEKSKQEIEYFANYDVLTGLYNRNNFEKLHKSLDYSKDVCVLICDVDGLKLINDAFGHIEGDKLLVHLAHTLEEVGGSKNVFRIGGDEFVIIIYDANEELVLSIEKSIKDQIHKFRLHSVGFDASIGYSFINKNKTFEDTFKKAENLMYRRKLTERKSRKSNALETIMQTMHERTEETEEHCHRVGDLSAELLKMTGRKRDYEIEEIKLVADVHDIGKISINDQILGKPNKLTEHEYEMIKYHSESGYKIISNIIDNEDIAVAVLYHHEKWDGTGYPHGLKGTKIPVYSRIIAICDAYDAMTSNRVYRDALSVKQAIREITRSSGTQFDPELVEYFLKIVK